MALWMWLGRAGVFGHDAALALHGLSNVPPALVHLTLPNSWRGRRLRTPDGVMLHDGDVGDPEWVGHVPTTSHGQTIRDCTADGLEPDVIDQGVALGLFTRAEVAA